MPRGFDRERTNVHKLQHHFIWCPKYRKSVLEGEVRDRLEELIEEKADELDLEILELAIRPDHVHLFLSAHPKHTPSEIVRTVKSITAREMWEQHESFLEEYLWGGGFWEQSYYIGTAGTVSTETIERYIERTEHV